MANLRLFLTLGIAVGLLAALGTVCHYQSIANSERTVLRAQIEHSTKLLAQVNSSLAATETTVGPVTEELQGIAAVERQRHDEATSDSPDLDTLQSLVHEEQADYDTFSGSAGIMLASMRALTNAIEAAGTGTDTRDLRSHLDDITTNLMAGEDACAVASRMLADNLEALQRYGVFGLMSTSSASDIQHSYDQCDDHFTTAMGNLPSFHDSAAHLRDVLSDRLHSARTRYLRIHGPFDWLFRAPQLAPQVMTQDPGGTVGSATTPGVEQTAFAPSNAPTSSGQIVSAQQQGPLPAGDVLPLLRATSALTVSGNPDGHTAYVTVPDTPASGTADSNRIIRGQLADGRWVVFVPLASGSPSVGDMYSLAWVWINGRATFVGEIPAENNGLGQLSTSVRDGEIYISWPVCCPRAIRTKVNTLDGIQFRLLSDTTS